MGATSAGSVQFDLEVKAKLEKGIEEEAIKIAKALKTQLGKMNENMFVSLSKSVENAMKAMTDAVKRQTELSKKTMQTFVNDMTKIAKGLKIQNPGMPISAPVSSTVKNDDASSIERPRAPPLSAPKINIPKPKMKFDTQFDTDIAKSQMQNLERELDNVNAMIENQQNRLKKLKNILDSTWNKSAKNGIEEQILKTESAINKLIAKSDQLGYTLSAMDRGQQKASSSAKTMSGAENTASISISKLIGKMKKLNESFRSKLSGMFHKNMNDINKSTQQATRSTSSYHMSLKRLISSFFIFSMIFPIVSRGIMALITSLGQSLMANQQFANSFIQIRSNLMTAFMPIYNAVLPALNALMNALATVTAYIAKFVSALFGTTYAASFKAAQGLVAAKDAMGAYGSAAKKAGKDAKDAMNATLGIDELNIIQPKKEAENDAGSGGNAPEMSSTDLSGKEVSNIEKMVKNLKKTLSDVFKPFKDSWNKYGSSIIGNIKSSFKNIADIAVSAGNIIKDNWYTTMRPLADLFLGLLTAATLVFEGITILFKMAWNNGGSYLFDQILKLIGNVARLGSLFLDTFVNPWLQGINGSLMPAIGKLLGSGLKVIGEWVERLNNKITDFIDNFDMNRASESVKSLKSSFQDAFGKIAAVVAGVTVAIAAFFAIKPAMDIINWCRNFVMVGQKMGFIKTIMLGLKTVFFDFSTVIATIVSPIGLVVIAIASLVAGFTYLYTTCDTFRERINEIFSSIATNIGGIISGIIEIVKTLYDLGIKPVIDSIMQAFDNLWNNGLSLLIENVSVFAFQFIDFITGIWNNAINPLVNLLLTVFLPVFTSVWDGILAVAVPIIKKIMEYVNLFMDILNICMDVLNKNVLPIFKLVFNGLSEAISAFWDFVQPIFKWFTDLLGNVVSFALDFFLSPLTVAFGTVVTVIKNIVDPIKQVFEGVKKIFKGIIDFVTGVFTGDWSKAWEGIKSIFSGIWESLKGIVSAAWNAILGLFSNGGKIFSGVVDGIASVFKTIVNCIINGINKVISFPFDKINGLLNSIRNIKIPLVGKPFAGLWGENPLPVPQIPALARGGIINQPTIAMVGEQGREAVMPLENNTGWIDVLAGKLAGKMSGNSNEMSNYEIIALLQRLVDILESLELVADFDVNGLVKLIDNKKKRLGVEIMR